MKNTNYNDTLLIANRANVAEGNTFGKFYKSYVKNAHIIRAEQTTPNHTELDFEFEHKGNKYRLYSKVASEFSAKETYRIERV